MWNGVGSWSREDISFANALAHSNEDGHCGKGLSNDHFLP